MPDNFLQSQFFSQHAKSIFLKSQIFLGQYLKCLIFFFKLDFEGSYFKKNLPETNHQPPTQYEDDNFLNYSTCLLIFLTTLHFYGSYSTCLITFYRVIFSGLLLNMPDNFLQSYFVRAHTQHA